MEVSQFSLDACLILAMPEESKAVTRSANDDCCMCMLQSFCYLKFAEWLHFHWLTVPFSSSGCSVLVLLCVALQSRTQ